MSSGFCLLVYKSTSVFQLSSGSCVLVYKSTSVVQLSRDSCFVVYKSTSECQVSSGCVAAVALVLGGQIYVANVGDCTAFLVHRWENTVLVKYLTLTAGISIIDTRNTLHWY